MKAVPIGARGEAEETVEFEHTLTSHHPQLPPVYSTPDMIRLMETAAFLAIQPFCEGDEISVGTAINVEHRAASGIGAKIKAEATVEAFDGRFYTVRVSARDDLQEIGRGTVSRAVVSVAKFWTKSELLRDDDREQPHPVAKNATRMGQPLHSLSRFEKPGREMTNLEMQLAKAEAFRAMHRGPNILILPNAWDAATARIFEAAGVAAIATTSAGIAFTLGYPDGQKISRAEMLSCVARIAAKVKIPVTADVEAGYGDRPEDAALTARAVIEAGAVGLNLEDGTDDPQNPLTDLSLQLEKIAAMRQTAQSSGIPLVVNARTDVFLSQVGKAEGRFAEAVRRLAAFRDAGADCLFVPGLRDLPTIAQLVRELHHPINILAGPGSPTIPELQKIGVARVSLGSAPMRATLGLARRIAHELQTTGTYASLEGAPSHAEVNRMLE